MDILLTSRTIHLMETCLEWFCHLQFQRHWCDVGRKVFQPPIQKLVQFGGSQQKFGLEHFQLPRKVITLFFQFWCGIWSKDFYLCTFHSMKMVHCHACSRSINVDMIVEKDGMIFSYWKAMNHWVTPRFKSSNDFWLGIINVIRLKPLNFYIVALEEITSFVLIVQWIVSAWLPHPMGASRSRTHSICWP